LCFKETISEHRETYSPDCTRDLIDSFLEEMELRKKETDSTFNGRMNNIYLPDIRRVLHLTAILMPSTYLQVLITKKLFAKLPYFPAYKMHRTIRRTMIFFVRNFRKKL
jgi:hypothetical protein